jgi:hypothetical protein
VSGALYSKKVIILAPPSSGSQSGSYKIFDCLVSTSNSSTVYRKGNDGEYLSLEQGSLCIPRKSVRPDATTEDLYVNVGDKVFPIKHI